MVVLHSGPEPIAPAVIRGHPSVEFRIDEESRLPGAQRNRGVGETDSRWIGFVDADCVVTDGWLEALVGEATATGAAGIGAAIEYEPIGDGPSWVMHMLEFGSWLPGRRSSDTDDFPSCNAVYDRNAFITVGGFPEDLFPCEDTALNTELRNRGYRLRFHGGVSAIHIHTRSRGGVKAHNERLGVMYASLAERRNDRRWLRRRVAAPIVFLARLSRVVGRTIRYRPRDLSILARNGPLVAICIVRWVRGFVRGPDHGAPSQTRPRRRRAQPRRR